MQALKPMSADEIRHAIVNRAIDEPPYGPDQGGTVFYADGTTCRDGFVSGLRGTYAISDGKVVITEELRSGDPSTTTIEFFVDAYDHIFYRCTGSNRDIQPSRLKLVPISPN